MLVLAAALTLADFAFGAPFPEAVMIEGPRVSSAADSTSGRKQCFVDYKLSSTASIPTIAKFYLDQGKEEKARLLGDTRDRFKDYRTITFGEPNFMFVVLSRVNKSTHAKVTLRMPDNCRAPGASPDYRP